MPETEREKRMIRGKGALSLNSIADVWKNVLDRLRSQLSETTINTWFDEVEVVTMEDSAFVLHCSNSFKKSTIEARFMSHIKAALKDIFSSDLEVKILDDQQLSAYHGVAPDRPGSLLESDAFTFGTYVVGPQNKMAYAAARAVADGVGHYNPLFIYGDSGLGKTHLIYAIAHQIRTTRPSAKIIYIKGDDFINEFIELVRAGRGSEFRAKYRDADLLLVDDVQFVAGKEQVQNEFFHTFNTLYEAGRQIVLTSDRPPSDMHLLDDRLRTRFEWGLLVDVQPPDFETRLAIVKNKAAQWGTVIDDDIAKYIAENVTSNVRQLEGTMNKILAYRDLIGREMDADAAHRAVEDFMKKNANLAPTAAMIITETSRYFGIDEEVIKGPSRSREAVNARQAAMYLVRRMTNLSTPDIGREFGKRDHTTVLHSLEQIEKKMKSDPVFNQTIKEITININSKR